MLLLANSITPVRIECKGRTPFNLSLKKFEINSLHTCTTSFPHSCFQQIRGTNQRVHRLWNETADRDQSGRNLQDFVYQVNCNNNTHTHKHTRIHTRAHTLHARTHSCTLLLTQAHTHTRIRAHTHICPPNIHSLVHLNTPEPRESPNIYTYEKTPTKETYNNRPMKETDEKRPTKKTCTLQVPNACRAHSLRGFPPSDNLTDALFISLFSRRLLIRIHIGQFVVGWAHKLSPLLIE